MIFALALTGLPIMSAPVWAGVVTLTSTNGSVAITGELLSVDNGEYRVRTALGEMTVPTDNITCNGDGCPTEPAIVEPLAAPTESSGLPTIELYGSDTVGDGVVPLLISGYSASIGAALDPVKLDEYTTNYTVIAQDGYGDPLETFKVVSLTSGKAFPRLQDSPTSIGMASRRIKPNEARALTRAGAGALTDPSQEHIIAIDSIVAIVNPENPISSISLTDLARIYAGEITNWAQLGGADMAITVYTRPETSGTRAVFESRVLGRNPSRVISTVKLSNEDMSASVAEFPGAIGYVSYAFIQGAKPLDLVSECGIPSSPDAFSAKTEEYPLARQLYLYNTNAELDSPAADLLNFADSSAADGVITKSGYINLAVERRAQDLRQKLLKDQIDVSSDKYIQGQIREALVELFQWDRLSISFRFAAGSNRLTPKGVKDMARLLDYLETQPAGSRIGVVGFTDNDGAFSANRSLSIQRAESVAAQIQTLAGDRLAGLEFQTFGFGEMVPASCNTSVHGKEINRRVEIWIAK